MRWKSGRSPTALNSPRPSVRRTGSARPRCGYRRARTERARQGHLERTARLGRVGRLDARARQGGTARRATGPARAATAALESLKRLRRPCKITFMGLSMAGVQAAVSADSVCRHSRDRCSRRGFRYCPPAGTTRIQGESMPDPGRMNIGVLRGPGGPRNDVVNALERVIRQTLDVLAVRVA